MLWEWRQPGLQNHRRRLRRCEEADQRTGSLGLPDSAGEHPHEKGRWLNLGRNRADKGNSRNMYQLANLLEADLRLATRDDCRYWLAGRRPSYLSAFARDLVCDAELLKHRC